ncbi:oligopeptide ABC transporter permease OppB [soil metagenome]
MKYFLQRLPIAALTLWVVATMCFVLTKLAGEDAAFGERNPTPEVRAEIIKKWGLDRPYYVQYWMQMKKLLVLDSMESRKQKNKTVRDVLKANLPSSLRVGFRALLLAIILGVPIGVWCAVYHNRPPDNGGTFISLMGVSVPSFILASFAIYFLTRSWSWPFTEVRIFKPMPALGWETAFYTMPDKPHFWDQILEELSRHRLWIPAACLGAFPFAAIMRLTRSAMLDALQQDYVRTARAKGVAAWKVIMHHALRNALTPIVTYIGPVTAGVLTGSLVIEKIFAIPGIGRFFVESVSNRDMPMIMGITVFYSSILIVMNMMVDAVYPILNPRLRR